MTNTQTSLVNHYKLYLGGIIPDSLPNQTYSQWLAKSEEDKENDLKNWTNSIAKPFVINKITECGELEENQSTKIQLQEMLDIINTALSEWGF